MGYRPPEPAPPPRGHPLPESMLRAYDLIQQPPPDPRPLHGFQQFDDGCGADRFIAFVKILLLLVTITMIGMAIFRP